MISSLYDCLCGLGYFLIGLRLIIIVDWDIILIEREFDEVRRAGIKSICGYDDALAYRHTRPFGY